MKIFKSVEEMIEFIKDSENIETLDNGEVTLKDQIELNNSAEKYKNDYGKATKDKHALRKKQEEADKKVTELTTQLDLVNDELISLKESQNGDNKEALQKAIKEKSEAIVQRNALKVKIKEYEKNQARITELEKEVADYKAANMKPLLKMLEQKNDIAVLVGYSQSDYKFFSRLFSALKWCKQTKCGYFQTEECKIRMTIWAIRVVCGIFSIAFLRSLGKKKKLAAGLFGIS